MIVEIVALAAGVIAGAIGGYLYQIVPNADGSKEPKANLRKRIIAGAVIGGLASPAMLVAISLGYEAAVTTFGGIILAGYAAIDTLKAMLQGRVGVAIKALRGML
jgi:hypothetical protein